MKMIYPDLKHYMKKTKCIMYRKAYSILNNLQLAEDSVADVYLAVVRLYSKIGNMSLEEQQRCLYIEVKNNAYRISGELSPPAEVGESLHTNFAINL